MTADMLLLDSDLGTEKSVRILANCSHLQSLQATEVSMKVHARVNMKTSKHSSLFGRGRWR